MLTTKSVMVRLIHTLPATQQAVLSLYYHERLEFDEIAKVLNFLTPEGFPDTAKVRRLYVRGISSVLCSSQPTMKK